MKFFKAFNNGMICNEKKYEENIVYEEDGEHICCPGMMHFCETPFDTLDYYPLVDDNGDFSEFAEVEPMAKVIKKGNKYASKKIKIGAKLSFKQFINSGVDILTKKVMSEGGNGMSSDNGENFAQIGSSGYNARIGSSGYSALIGSSGKYTQIGSSGDYARIGSSGDYARIGSSGDYAQIGCSGDYTQIGSSGYGVLIGSSGNCARIGSSGHGARISLKGERSVAAAVGHHSSIKGKKGDWIVLAEWKQDERGFYPVYVKTGLIDGNTLKEDVFYHLENGEFVAEERREQNGRNNDFKENLEEDPE